jgi:hypothetical protein
MSAAIMLGWERGLMEHCMASFSANTTLPTEAKIGNRLQLEVKDHHAIMQ